MQGDLVGLSSGMSVQYLPQTNRSILNWLRAAAPVQALAGATSPAWAACSLHNGPSDVSLLHAGRDIWYADVKVAGPGLLDVVAGRNLVQEDRASIVSVGPRCAAISGRARISRSRRAPARPDPTTTRWASATWTRPIAPWPARP